MIQEVLNLREEGDFKQLTSGLASAARTAYALLTEGDRQNIRQGVRGQAEIDGFEDLSTLLGFINSQPKGKLNARAKAEYDLLYERLTTGDAGTSILERLGFYFRGADDKHFFVDEADNEAAATNRLLLCKLITEQNVDTYFQQAMNTGQGMVNLNVNTSTGLSSMFILRETLKQARTKYNYVASADDTAFIYHLMVWCLDNCLGARRQTSQEKRSIGDLFQGMMNNLRERREENVENVIERAFMNAGIDAHQEGLLIEILLEGLN
tara:strand:- start:829 stop:1626 length:798 start_codon:yes stop_codon:yes gene_type:complete